MQSVLIYNQDSAVKAGGGDYITEGGAHICTITQAKYIKSKKLTDGIEFSVVNDAGLKANYINVYFQKVSENDSQKMEPISGGVSMLNAMMGLLQIRQMSAVQSGVVYNCPEFLNKKVGLFLQKKLTRSKDGKDSYGFDISVPFNPVDKKTMREIIDNKPAQTIDRMTASYKDKDERKAASVMNQSTEEQYEGFGNFN